VLSGAIGLSLGLIGGGGSIITVPVLVYALGVEAHAAIGMSLAVVGVTSLIGAALHDRRGMVDWRAGGLFGMAGIAGAMGGSRLTYLLSSSALLLTFAGLMLVVASFMLLRPARSGAPARRSLAKALGAGLAIGVLTGFLGVGGGFLIVPALLLFGGLDIKKAIGTSLVVISINCGAGLLGHLTRGLFDLRLAALVAGCAAAGALVGTSLSHRTSPERLRRGFAFFVIAVAVFLVVRNYNPV